MVLRIIAFIAKLRAMSVFTRVFDALWRASKGAYCTFRTQQVFS